MAEPRLSGSKRRGAPMICPKAALRCNAHLRTCSCYGHAARGADAGRTSSTLVIARRGQNDTVACVVELLCGQLFLEDTNVRMAQQAAAIAVFTGRQAENSARAQRARVQKVILNGH